MGFNNSNNSLDDFRPEIKRYVQDRYGKSPGGNLQAFFNLAHRDKQPVYIQFNGMFQNSAFVLGIVDHVGEDYIVMLGSQDDIVAIPFTAILVARMYNEELDDALMEEIRKQQALLLEEQKKEAEAQRKAALEQAKRDKLGKDDPIRKEALTVLSDENTDDSK